MSYKYIHPKPPFCIVVQRNRLVDYYIVALKKGNLTYYMNDSYFLTKEAALQSFWRKLGAM